MPSPWGRKIYDDLVKEWAALIEKIANPPKADTEINLRVGVFPFPIQCWFLEGLTPTQYQLFAKYSSSNKGNSILPRIFRWDVKKRPDYGTAKRSMLNQDEVKLCIIFHPFTLYCNLLQPVAPCCTLLQPVAPCCTLLQPVAFYLSNILFHIFAQFDFTVMRVEDEEISQEYYQSVMTWLDAPLYS